MRMHVEILLEQCRALNFGTFPNAQADPVSHRKPNRTTENRMRKQTNLPTHCPGILALRAYRYTRKKKKINAGIVLVFSVLI